MSSCELHSRSLAVGRTGACAILRLRTCVMQSRDCTHVLCNLEIAHTCYAISRLRTRVTQSRDCLRNLGILRMRNAISRLRKFPDCAEHIHYKPNLTSAVSLHHCIKQYTPPLIESMSTPTAWEGVLPCTMILQSASC